MRFRDVSNSRAGIYGTSMGNDETTFYPAPGYRSIRRVILIVTQIREHFVDFDEALNA